MRHRKGKYYAGTVKGREGYWILQCTNECDEHDCFALVTAEGSFASLYAADQRACQLNETQTN